MNQQLQEEIGNYSNLLKKSKDQSRFLKKLFYRIQREYLVEYASNTQLANLLVGSKQYDCVTGTALYALVLDALQIDYSIKETDFHVYLLVHLSGKDILFESTDPIYGFIENPVVISDRVREYASSSSETVQRSSKSASPFKISFYRDRVISITELAGLQYYNLATEAFNNGSQDIAIEYIEIALSLYPNDRLSGFREILLVDLSQSMSTNYSSNQE